MQAFKKRTVSAAIALMIILTLVLAGCGTGGKPSSVDTSAPTDTSTPSTEPARIYPDLPEMDMEGHTFTILNIDHSIPIWVQRDIYAEEQNGELINDAVYLRNRAIEEKYNCKIASKKEFDTTGQLAKFIKSGDSLIDFATVLLNHFPTIAATGGLVEYGSIPYIDLSKPWWDPASVEALSIDGKLFAACSDITIRDKDAITAMVFNKKLLSDFALENPYKLVDEGKWTIDKLKEMSKTCSADLDGNGKYDDNDRYGLLYQRDTMSSLMSGCGGLIAKKDENDLPIMTLLEPSNVEVLDKLYDFLYDEQICFHVMKFFDPTAEGFTNGMTRMFTNNQALFMWIRMADVVNLRAMDTDFGILPIPKKDEAQKTYLHTVNPYAGTVVVVPQSAENLERVGVVLEALSAESKYVLQPAYYDVMLTSKLTRDEESLEMLDIIFHNRVYDIGDIYNFGTIANDLIYMTMKYDRSIVSTYDKKTNAVQKAIEKVITSFQAIE